MLVQLENNMATNKIGNVPAVFLTHRFMYNGKECLIGRFDPENPGQYIDAQWKKLGPEVMAQVVQAGIFNESETQYLHECSPEEFLGCIYEL
jgi:hypothetical protein